MDRKKARTRSGETLSAGGTIPLKPKDGLNGPPSRFFLIDRRKIFQLKELRVYDPCCSAQNLQNKELICKIFQNKDLAEHLPV